MQYWFETIFVIDVNDLNKESHIRDCIKTTCNSREYIVWKLVDNNMQMAESINNHYE